MEYRDKESPGHRHLLSGCAALARIVELGGSTVTAAQDTPYGRLATAADPTGAQFKLVAPNEAAK